MIDVPKIVHFYWGNSHLPYLRYLTVKSFSDMNPDWQIRFYVPSKTDSPRNWASRENKYETTGENYLERIPAIPSTTVITVSHLDQYPISDVHKSDLLRWAVLHSTGGIWSDMDILYFNPIDVLPVENTHNDYLCRYPGSIVYPIGFIGSKGGSELFKETLAACHARLNGVVTEYQGLGSTVLNGILLRYKVNVFEPHYVYPVDCIPHSSKLVRIFSPGSVDCHKGMAIHWYGGCPAAERFVNEFSAASKRDDGVLLTNCIKYYESQVK
jgi:mannosyltransferase OCH1-like enzyme